MKNQKCQHEWTMINVQTDLSSLKIVIRCHRTSTYFSFEERPPLEEYREGEHFWNVMQSAQTFRFDLACKKCAYRRAIW